MTAPVAILLVSLAALPDAGVDGGATGDLDGGTPATVEVGGLQIAIAADSHTPGHRPVEGVVDDLPLESIRRPRIPEVDYEEFLEQRTADLSICASWSSDGRAVKGWLSAEWTVGADGVPSGFRVLSNDLGSPLVERCMLREMSAWRFVPPPGGEKLVRHNFYFSLPARGEVAPTLSP